MKTYIVKIDNIPLFVEANATYRIEDEKICFREQGVDSPQTNSLKQAVCVPWLQATSNERAYLRKNWQFSGSCNSHQGGRLNKPIN